MNVTVPVDEVLQPPKRHELVFSEERRRTLYEFLNTPGWETGWKSNRERDGFTFLHKHFAGWRASDKQSYDCQEELKLNAPVIFDAWLDVRDKIFAGHTLVRCYANGMSYGMDGTVHTRQLAARQLHRGVLPARTLVAELGRRDDVLQQAGEPHRLLHVSAAE